MTLAATLAVRPGPVRDTPSTSPALLTKPGAKVTPFTRNEPDDQQREPESACVQHGQVLRECAPAYGVSFRQCAKAVKTSPHREL